MLKMSKKCENNLKKDESICKKCSKKQRTILNLIAVLIYAIIMIFFIIKAMGFVGELLLSSIIENVNSSLGENANILGLEYMEKKYGEKFTYHSPTGNSLSGTRQFFATCESLPGKKVLVQIENFREDNKIYSDNYMAVKYQEETIEFFQDSALEYFKDVRVFYKPKEYGGVTDLSVNSSFEEYLEGEVKEFVVMIEIKKDDSSLNKTREQVELMIKKS